MRLRRDLNPASLPPAPVLQLRKMVAAGDLMNDEANQATQVGGEGVLCAPPSSTH